ncbi:MAG: hypothetical protein ACT4OJ_04805 [Bacteroidota bacterium]
MKRTLLAAFALLAVVFTALAQPGSGFTRRSPEERAAAIHQKLDSAFKLDAATLAKVDTAITALYRAQDKKREELMAGGPGTFDRETMQAEMKKYSDAQDEILKAVLTEEQFGIWKEKIQPSMRPQRPQGPPPGSGGNK